MSLGKFWQWKLFLAGPGGAYEEGTRRAAALGSMSFCPRLQGGRV